MPRGPVPKRSDQRRRVNKPETPIDTAPAAAEFVPPKSLTAWHPIARRWYDSLAASGQSTFYEPSDWALAAATAEALSRELKPQVVTVTGEGVVVRASLPVKGATFVAFLKASGLLLATEGDRRRLRLELLRQGADGEDGDTVVSELDEYRARLEAAGAG
jgi:hypothetical protein